MMSAGPCPSSAANRRQQFLPARPCALLLAGALLLAVLASPAGAQEAGGNSTANPTSGSNPSAASLAPPAPEVVPASTSPGTSSIPTASPVPPATNPPLPATPPSLSSLSSPPSAASPPAAAPSASLPPPAAASTPSPSPSPPHPAELPPTSLSPAAAPTSTAAPSLSPLPTGPATAPAPSSLALQQLSVVLRLSGAGLLPWSKTKADQVLTLLVGTLQAAGLAASGSDLVLVNAQASTSAGRRRLRDTASSTNSVAAIPSLYTLTQAVQLQAVVAALPGSQPAVQDALVAASTSGQLAMALRNQGMSVSQVETLAVYAGTADPPSDLDAITATSTGTAPATGGIGAGTESTSKAAPGMAVIIGVAAGVGGAVLLTVGMFVYLRLRRGPGSSSDAAGGYRFDKSAAKRSPAPRRTASGSSLDLEGACTPRFRQPITPRRSALKGDRDGGGGAVHLHVVAAGLPAPRAPETQLLPGVHLMPRAPSGAAASAGGASCIPRSSSATSIGPRVPASATRTAAAAAVHDMQDAQRAAHLAQQAAEQAAMRDYLRSLPPQVVWEDVAAAQAARNMARAQSRLARQASRHHQGHGHPSHRMPGGSQSSLGPSSYTAGASGPGSAASGPSAPTSEAGYPASDASEIEPAGGAQPHTHTLARQRSLEARVAAGGGGGGGPLPEAMKRAAAKVQPGSPRRSAARVKGAFASKDSEGGVGLSRLARGSSAQAEPLPDGLEAACVHDRHELTGAWISTGGQLSPRRMASHGGSAVQEEAEQQQ